MCNISSVPRIPRGAGPIGLALSAYDVWRRLSPRQKKIVLEQMKRHGPRIAGQAVRSARAAAESMRKKP
jgi:hypothetical protein